MSKNWNGSFPPPEYKKTGNPVLDVIENNGRVISEPTSDGYTHEVVDRDNYITDDYYFPQRVSGKKPHIHYELRSNGDVLIDGKSLINRKGERSMNKIKFPGGYGSKDPGDNMSDIKNATDNRFAEVGKIQELGEKFEKDKAEIEQQFEFISNLPIIGNEEKKGMLLALKKKLFELQAQYEQDVAEAQENQKQEIISFLIEMQEKAEQLEKQSESLQRIKFEAVNSDLSDVAAAADAKKQEIEETKSAYSEQLRLKMEQFARQQRSIKSSKISGDLN